MTKRVTESRVKTFAQGAGLTGVPLAIALLILLFGTDSLTIDSYSGDMVCGGEKLCYAEINVTFKEDVFIYPMDGAWMFETDKQVTDFKMHRTGVRA